MTSHLDIMPTILVMLGITPNIALEGQDLFTDTDGPRDSRTWLGMTSSGGFAEPDPQRIRYFEYASLHEKWKARLRIAADGSETFNLYDLSLDPRENHDQAAARPDIAALHRKRLQSAIVGKVQAPIRIQEASTGAKTTSLSWLYPACSGSYGFEELADSFRLQWSGAKDCDYLLEYRAGHGRKELSGTLPVRGTTKDFGTIDRRYWQTWIVPNSPFLLRVCEARGADCSPWLNLEAIP